MMLAGEELLRLGVKQAGRDCAVHSTVQFFNPQHVVLGDNVRIDCFCVISASDAGVVIGSHIHIGAGCYLFGSGGKIVLGDFSGLAPGVRLFTASDDFIEGYLIGPIVPLKYRKVTQRDVVLHANAGVGTGSVVLPGVTLGENSRVGALSLVSRNVDANTLVAGNPLRNLGQIDGDMPRRLMAAAREDYLKR